MEDKVNLTDTEGLVEDTPSKKRGRPTKEDPPVHNEQSKMVTMSQATGTPMEQITLESLSARWRTVFQKYSNLGFSSISGMWQSINNSMLNNPYTQNQRVKKILTPPIEMTKEDLKTAMSDPENSETSLRSASLDLYYKNYIYQNITQLYRNTPRYNYCFTPVLSGEEKFDKTKLQQDSSIIDKALKKFNPQLTLRTVATQVAIEGKSAYLVRTSHTKKDVNFLVLQKLNSDNVKITGFGSKQQFIVSFNMIIFLEAGYSIEQYPKFIQDAWNEMIGAGVISEGKGGKKRLNPKSQLPKGHMLQSNGTSYDYWVELPQDLCYMFYTDGAHPNVFPDTIGLFVDMNELDDYRWLQGNLLSKGVTSILTGEVPLV